MLITNKGFFQILGKKSEESIAYFKEQRELRRAEMAELEDDDDDEYDYEDDYDERGRKRKARTVTFMKEPKEKKAKEEARLKEEDEEEFEQGISFLDQLKEKGKKGSEEKEYKEAKEHKGHKEAADYGKETLPVVDPFAHTEYTITGDFMPSDKMIEDVNSIYEEELQRKFGSKEMEELSDFDDSNGDIKEEQTPDINSLGFETNHLSDQEVNGFIANFDTDQMSEEEFSDYKQVSGTHVHENLYEQKLPEEMEGGFYSEEKSDSGSNARAAGAGGRSDSVHAREHAARPDEKLQSKAQDKSDADLTAEDLAKGIHQVIEEKKYEFPPINLLAKPKHGQKGMTDKDLKETALKLQKTLDSFGVRVTITNISCGPAVTRYELQPEQGVKVKTITALADDIKLNLAAEEIRIEAPIPGKAAVGIEVPNKENSAVMLRELLDTKDFKEHSSSIAFAVGKDIGGQAVVTDIAKMPHLLIAGATGSGKSVCINTLIMSILYKANPADVRLIMVDPKVVELSIYNGIPHLLIPVVTDPKKASAALNWAVMEMNDRYKKFAELGVRDLKGYNEKVAEVKDLNDPNYQKLPQIVIIVDELADLMMVASGEVEDAICRLAQMARAAGLHLIIATQRPSVNVITGLIKANVPSRIAFSVSSAIDSRTIIDGAGAEKLLGKGDMLFFPSGYPKPVRVQGAFVSDKEVNAVVDFLKEQNAGANYSEEINNKIASVQASGDSGNGSAGGGSNKDDYFIEAGKFIIERDKASIGMLQRVYKIGFNRAARIMDQLCDAGVVGPEEGTKPRKVLMSMEEFEEYVDEYV
ncbi:MAG: DNA translocase FtsK [Lachnospiraceae bacterium]|nr:DNA translocase FtsK [Lachnospiraceae bacterium]